MVGESYQSCLDPALKLLEKSVRECPSSTRSIILELRFFKMFFWGLAYLEESEHDWHLRFSISTMLPKLSQVAKEFEVDFVHAHYPYQKMNWEEVMYDLKEKIQHFMPQVKDICIFILGRAFKCKSCPQNQGLFLEYGKETASFIDLIQQNLNSLKAVISSVADLGTIVKKIEVILLKKIEVILLKLEELRNFVTSVLNHSSISRVKILCDLLCRTRTCASHISCLVCRLWLQGKNESFVSTMSTMLSDLMYRTLPYTPGVVALYLEGTMIPKLLTSYYDFLMDDMVVPMKDGVQILRERLIFLLSFVIDPPKEDSKDKELILTKIYAVINEVPFLVRSIHFDAMKEGSFEARFSSFLQKIDRVKTDVRELCHMTPHSLQFNFPKTNGIAFLDSLLGNLKKMWETKVNFDPFVKPQVEVVLEELVSLWPSLQNVMDLQNEHEIKDLWIRTIDMLYNADYVIKFCSVDIDIPLWHFAIWFSNAIENIELIKFEVKRIEADKICSSRMLSTFEMKPSDALPLRATTSNIEVDFVGFKKDAELIVDYLTRGQACLTIISISGLPGQGKTTLAKRVYNDPNIQCRFLKTVWCYVSKDCAAKELLVQILHDVSGVDVRQLEIQDLVEQLRKSLKGKRYLIVMDDIWDVDGWCQIEGSFPDDKNGSRILFTSRNHDLASQAKPNSISHPLPLFSDKESWELMKQKLFQCDGCPSEFLKIGKQIASYCKGLPLAVVLITAILGRNKKKLEFWIETAKDLKSHLDNEGCMEIIELSYKHLPDHLKPCFLYFGTFQRGKNVRAQKLKLLWIAEGFIKDNEMQSSKDLANGYLTNLISLNLVVLTEKSSTGGIKKCNVHDLLYDMCLKKAMEDNFLSCTEKSTIIDSCDFGPQKYNHHRLCISKSDPLIKLRPLVSGKDLPTSMVYSLLWYEESYNYSLSHIFESFKILTVLDLEGVNLISSSFPEAILSIIHLRYLALNCSHIRCIPSSIANLWNLETLIMRGIGATKYSIPFSMWKMKSLRHVELPMLRLQLEDFVGNDDSNDILGCCNVERLGSIIVKCDGNTAEFLRKLSKLRKLACYFDDDASYPLWFSMFGSLTQVESLVIGSPHSFYPCENPRIFNFPENLKKLTLDLLHLPWSAMSEIDKQLPNLEVLKLLRDSFVGSTWILEVGHFSKLRCLKLKNLEIKEIDVSKLCDDIPFPSLEQLIVDGCPCVIPSSFGNIYTLKTIRVIDYLPETVQSVKEILATQREMDNYDLQVIYVTRIWVRGSSTDTNLSVGCITTTDMNTEMRATRKSIGGIETYGSLSQKKIFQLMY